ncbi:MAG: hypothetical protein GY823_06690 [Flavobacteriaceae bacterium]|nr:hypothetical protein [Flavobacteriaceae bacterium]
MKLNRLLFVAVITLILQTQISFAEESKHAKVVKPLIEAFKVNDRSAISKMITYPLSRKVPLPSIKNESEFISRFDQVFDVNLVNTIVNSDPEKDWSAMGWRGIRNKLINKQKKSLHKSVANFKKPILEWHTKSFHIRIDDVGNNNFRYASWSINKLTTEKPDLVLLNGKITFEGSGGNHHYVFKNGEYVYRCYVSVIGNDTSPPGNLDVFKSDETLLSQPVIKVLSRN